MSTITSSLYISLKDVLYKKKDEGEITMKAHKYWSIAALIAMLGTFYTGYKNQKTAHKYFAMSSLLCMVMAIYSGHKMISGKKKPEKSKTSDETEE